MDKSDQYFDYLCRTCMNELIEASSWDGDNKPQQQLLSVFDIIEEEFGSLRIAELLSQAVAQLELQLSDELPKKICCKCLQQLLSVYRFQQMCLKSQQKMRQLVSKKHSDLINPAAAIAGEIGTNDTDSLKHSTMKEPLPETTERVVKPEATKIEDANQLLEYCGDSEGNFSEFVKNEPIEDDEPEMEYSDGDTIQSIISVKDEILAIESEEKQIKETDRQNDHYVEDRPYKCPHCPIRFRARQTMYQHKAIHEGVKREDCDICGKSITKKNLKKHRRTHKDEMAHNCGFCERSFLRIHHLRIHMRQHNADPQDAAAKLQQVTKTGSQQPPKDESQQQFGTKANENVKPHRIIHGEERPYECPYCPRRFTLKQNVYQHRKMHEGVKREDCDICGKSFRKNNLNQHKRIHSNEKAYKCDFCEKRFIQMSHLRCHVRQHTGEKPYKCKYCDSAFARSDIHRRHMRIHHGDNVHRCNLCPLGFSLATELRLHFTTHKNDDSETRERNMKALKEEEAKLKLTLAKSSTEKTQHQMEKKATGNVKTHRIIQDEDKSYECPYCPKRFVDSSSRNKHKQIHEGVKRAACDICGKSIRKSNLNQHKLIHRNEKAFKCDVCDTRFTQLSRLRIHMRKHTGEKPYKCKYCESSFARHDYRKKHMRMHFGDNVHRCHLCPLAFPSTAELRLHLTTHKNEDPETRERNMKALKEEEAKLKLKFAKSSKRETVQQLEMKGTE